MRARVEKVGVLIWNKYLNIKGKGEIEALIMITQYMKLVYENTWKKHNWPNTPYTKARWIELCSNTSSWDSRREAVTKIIQNYRW